MYQEFKQASGITVGIPTKNRYESLISTLLSVALQTLKPSEIIIVDDSDKFIDIRSIPQYQYVLKLLYEYKIDWKIIFGQKRGQHFSHQHIQDIASNNIIFRVDDDCVLEHNVIENLYKQLDEDTGAVSPLVLMPQAMSSEYGVQFAPPSATGKIDDIFSSNIQWFRSFDNEIKYVDHLYSCFLYRRGICKYDLTLSPVANREETIFTHSIKRNGFKLKVDPNSIVWHFRGENGGIRSHKNPKFYDDDEKIFQGYLNLWNVNASSKIFVLDSGLGDHYAFKNILPKIRVKYPGKKIILAVCYPDIFFDEMDLELISIQDAKNMFNDIGMFNIYYKMDEWKWNKSLTEAYEKLYL